MSKPRRFSPLARWLPLAAVLGAMGLAAALVLPRLGQRLFWDDEANTAIYARNLLRFGHITAWDGTNLCGYGQGGALGDDLGQELRVPALPAYVAAASMALFGETTFAGRLPFALAGVLSVGLLAIWMRRHFGRRFSWYLPSLLMAVSPAFLLYSRNCRYYSLGLMFSLAVLAFWAPGARRRNGQTYRRFTLGDWLRCAGAVSAFALLIGTHYLNAAALLATLPLMFLDRRFRNRRQVAIFGLLTLTAAAAGAWIMAVGNPLAAHYESGRAWLFAPPPIAGHWARFEWNITWFIRDLGSHEFIPWLMLAALPLPFLPWRRAARLRPLAWRGAILAALVLTYTILAAAATPPDMGKGPAAEMRYVVPLIAVGAALGGLALTLLWRIWKPMALPVAALLVGTNWLYLGGVIDRFDRADPWWPPTLYCYLEELAHPFRAGDEELIDLLARLPANTTVRIWPSFMVYPPMFYVPGLHYCDQLTEKKSIRPDLRRQLPDYLFVERARPDVVVVPIVRLGMAMDYLDRQSGANRYRVCKALREPFFYTQKPEIPMHWFWLPGGDWKDQPGAAVVLVAAGSMVEQTSALAGDQFDREHGAYALWFAALQNGDAGRWDEVVKYCEAALRLCPSFSAAHVSLGFVCENRNQPFQAIRHYRAAIESEPDNAVAHFNLAKLLAAEDEYDEAEQQYLKALAAKPDYLQAHYMLGTMLLKRDRPAEAREQFTSVLQLAPPGTRLAEEAKRLLRQMPK